MLSAVLVFGKEKEEARRADAHRVDPGSDLDVDVPDPGTAPAPAMRPPGRPSSRAPAAWLPHAEGRGLDGHVGPNLDELKPNVATVKHQVENGGGPMPAFKGSLSAKQIDDVAAYVASVAGKYKQPLNARNPPGGRAGFAAVTSVRRYFGGAGKANPASTSGPPASPRGVILASPRSRVARRRRDSNPRGRDFPT